MEKLIGAIDASLQGAGEMVREIKRVKMETMARFLGLQSRGGDPIEMIGKGFDGFPGRVITLGDAADGGIVQGVDISHGKRDASGMAVLFPDNIRELRFYAGEGTCGVQESFSQLFPRVRGGDILLVGAGEHAGASALFPLDREECLFGQGLYRVRADTSQCEPFYLLNLLHYYYNAGYMKTLSAGNGGSIGPELMAGLPVPLPDRESQKEISEAMLMLSTGMVAREDFDASMRGLKEWLRERRSPL